MPVIRRLPRYYRFLRELQSTGATRISSKELSTHMGLTASQIRQDFNCFGGFGQQGYGYNIASLCDEIGVILGLDRLHKCILIGAGKLGTTIATHMPFDACGFQLIGIFDKSPKRKDVLINGHQVQPAQDLAAFIQREHPIMAILCVPREGIEPLVDRLYQAGIHSFWNFSHYDIPVDYPDAVVENVHLNDSIMTLCYKITQQVPPAGEDNTTQ